MLERLATTVVRRRRLVLAATLGALFVAVVVGGGVTKLLSSGGFDDPNSESSQAATVLRDTLGAAPPNLTLLVTAKNGNVDAPGVTRLGAELTEQLRLDDRIESVISYWETREPTMRSSSGDRALILATIGGSDDEHSEAVEALGERFRADTPAVTVALGGTAETFREITETSERDLLRAESIAIPLTLVLLVLAFGNVVAGVLPAAIGGATILGALLVLRGIAELTDVSIFALNLVIALGLGLAIDYSLLIVFRYREELARGTDHAAAIVTTVNTAGRTVVFSAVIVAVSLAALVVFPTFFLRSFAYAGVAVVGVATVGALVVLPALLAVLGPRIDALPVRRRGAARRGSGGSSALWGRVARTVMRRPVLVAVPVVAFLLALGTPFLRVEWGGADDRVLPASAAARQVNDVVRAEFGSLETDALSVVVTDGAYPAGRDKAVGPYAARVSALLEVVQVEASSGTYAGGQKIAEPDAVAARMATESAAYLRVIPSVDANSQAGRDLVAEIRDLAAAFDVRVGGGAAPTVDSLAALGQRIPLAGGMIALVTLVLVFLLTGSVLIPVKALLMNLLSLTASYGAIVWIFQDGNLSGLLGFTATGVIATNMPILLFCIAFGLSMDYEVFLLSRIKEEHDRTGDTVESVARGLSRIGGLTTTAAGLISVVFLAMVSSEIALLKLFGLGAALAVIVDATLIRGLLVPAFMRLAGRANWWAPAPLRRVYHRVGLHESVPDPEEQEPAGQEEPAGRPDATGPRTAARQSVQV